VAAVASGCTHGNITAASVQKGEFLNYFHNDPSKYGPIVGQPNIVSITNVQATILIVGPSIFNHVRDIQQMLISRFYCAY
jgi:hypothetical protein